MTIAANSYSSVTEVQAVTNIYTDNGSYTASTRPTLVQVEKFIDRVSAMLNACLAKAGFTIPITQADAKLACDEWVTRMAADLCHYAVNSAPFSTAQETRGGTPNVYEQACQWVEDMASGLEALGAARSSASITQGLGYKETMDNGDAIVPLFQRNAFEWDKQVTDWDAA